MENKLWLSQYPAGIPANIDIDKYENMVEFAKECMTKYADKEAYECMGKTMTYREVDQLSDQFAAYLHSRGLQPTDKIALMML